MQLRLLCTGIVCVSQPSVVAYRLLKLPLSCGWYVSECFGDAQELNPEECNGFASQHSEAEFLMVFWRCRICDISGPSSFSLSFFRCDEYARTTVACV